MSKSAALIELQREPLCLETRPDRLVAHFLTPIADFFVRNHGPVPELGADHRVEVGGLVHRTACYSIADLSARFPGKSVTATIQCAGNRRADFQAVAPTSGDPWGVGAIGTARWTGVALADVLAAAGVGGEARHVGLTGADLAEGGDAVAPYEVSLPLDQARADGVLLAWAMNDVPLPPEHGFPLRLVVPGEAGVRSVKWLTRIELRAEEATAPMHAHDYRRFGPDASCENADWAAAPPIYALPVNSAICEPGEGATVAAGLVVLRGWAASGAAPVATVEVSGDDGETWRAATLERGPDADSWVVWQATLTLPPGRHHLIVRAGDASGDVQPADPAAIWNFKGYVSNAWHRIAVTAV